MSLLRGRTIRRGGSHRNTTVAAAPRPIVDVMIELLRTNDIVLISVVSSLLDESGIPYFVADEHMSVLEGSAGFLQRRVMVERDAASRARRLLTEAGFGEELKRG